MRIDEGPDPVSAGKLKATANKQYTDCFAIIGVRLPVLQQLSSQ